MLASRCLACRLRAAARPNQKAEPMLLKTNPAVLGPPMLLPSLSQRRNPVPDFDFVLFGATGDLAARKLLPALLQREYEGVLPSNGGIILYRPSTAWH